MWMLVACMSVHVCSLICCLACMTESALMWRRKDKAWGISFPSSLLPPLPQFSVSLSSDEVYSGVTVSPYAAVLIVVDRSSKHCLRDAESSKLSLWVRSQGFTQAALVDNLYLFALEGRLCNLGWQGIN